MGNWYREGGGLDLQGGFCYPHSALTACTSLSSLDVPSVSSEQLIGPVMSWQVPHNLMGSQLELGQLHSLMRQGLWGDCSSLFNREAPQVASGPDAAQASGKRQASETGSPPHRLLSNPKSARYGQFSTQNSPVSAGTGSGEETHYPLTHSLLHPVTPPRKPAGSGSHRAPILTSGSPEPPLLH